VPGKLHKLESFINPVVSIENFDENTSRLDESRDWLGNRPRSDSSQLVATLEESILVE